MEATGSYILQAGVQVGGYLRYAAQATLGKVEVYPFGGKHGLVLLGQGAFRLGKDRVKVLLSQAGQFHAQGEASL